MNIGILNRDMQQKIAQAGVIERLNHGSPKPRQNRNADEERMNWQMRALQTDTNRAKTFAEISFLSNESHCSKTSMEKLKPIMLKEMKVPMIHTGRYLICQCLCKPLPIMGVGTSVNGDKYFTSGVSMLIQDINVDSPSDIIFVDSADEEYLDKIGAKKWYIEKSKDAEVWRQKANECFKNGNFEKALFFYDRAIRCNPELSILYLNKSLTCLRTGAFYFAYEASKIGLEKGGDREKALYRMGQAAYGMREWQKAAELFLSVLKEFPSNTNASGELKRATSRLSEQKHGKYDSKAMLLESQKEKAEFDIADYMGPIEIAEIPGKGRGIIASKDISKGTLIGVSKAFSSGYSQDCDSKLFSMIKNSMASAHMQNKLKTMQNLQNNPKRSKEIYDLYSGDETAAKKEEIPFGVIEASLIQKICALNQYGSGGDDDEADVNCHLFILSSYFNHSCLGLFLFVL
uniref:SET domain-containing protein n=1 Tax=Panagrolaimus davidi TaxID=227884 RepID=A0A914QCX0_9BILA